MNRRTRQQGHGTLGTAGTTVENAADNLVISADFGTSSVKVAVVDSNFKVVARAIEAYPLALPEPGFAEQNPEDWWQALCRATESLAADVPGLADKVGALVFCAQMSAVVAIDAAGDVLRPCLVCVDKRSAEISQKLIGGFPSFEGYQIGKIARWIRLSNGAPSKNGVDPIGKMLWIKQHEPEIFAKTAKFLDVKDWLCLRASGVMSTGADSANVTWLMDTRRGKEGWSQDLSKRVGIPLDKLAPIVNGSDVLGPLTAQAAVDLGLRSETKMVAGGSDVSATALGAGLSEDGELVICASTSAWISAFLPKRMLNIGGSYATITSSVDFRPLVAASQETAGSAIDWAARMLNEGMDATAPMPAAFFEDCGAPEADDPYFLPWLAGERVPVDNERLRGAFVRLALHHDRTTMKRAVLEGVAQNLGWAFSKVVREKGIDKVGPVQLVGGLALVPEFAQMMADCLDRPMVVGDPRFVGILGAATMAAPAVGWAPTVWDAVVQLREKPNRRFDPIPARVALARARGENLQKIRKSMIKLYAAID